MLLPLQTLKTDHADDLTKAVRGRLAVWSPGTDPTPRPR